MMVDLLGWGRKKDGAKYYGGDNGNGDENPLPSSDTTLPSTKPNVSMFRSEIGGQIGIETVDIYGERVPLDTYMIRLLEKVHEEVMKINDWIFCIAGRRGSGKSILALRIAKYLEYLSGRRFNAQKQTFYTLPQLAEYLREVRDEPRPSGRVLLFDEAHFLFNKRESMKKESIIFTKILSAFRDWGLIYIFVLPRFSHIDVMLRECDVDTLFYLHYDRVSSIRKLYAYAGDRVVGISSELDLRNKWASYWTYFDINPIPKEKEYVDRKKFEVQNEILEEVIEMAQREKGGG